MEGLFRHTIEWWDRRGTPNNIRAMAFGSAMWESLVAHKLITSRRPSDLDTKVWLMTFVRLWRDANLEPGLTHSVDDWSSIGEWLNFHPERMVEFDDDDGVQIVEEMEMRMSEAYAVLGPYGLENIVQPYDEDLGATEENSTAWVNLLYVLGKRRKEEVERAQAQAPRLNSVDGWLIERLKKEPKDVFRISPYRFEDLIAELLEGMGFAVTLTPATDERGPGDQGRDILAWNKDAEGPYLLIVDTKKYRQSRPVGVSAVRTLLGAVVDETARRAAAKTRVRGMLIASSHFSPQAVHLQQRHEYSLTLKDFDDVVAWIKQHSFKP